MTPPARDSKLRVAVIGCGKPRGAEGATGFGMSHRHMAGFMQSGRCELAAVTDIIRKNAEAFVAEYGPGASIFSSYNDMMREIHPDVVSVSLWPHLHSEVVCNLAPHRPRIVLCEKPMDIHWDACLRMHQACKDNGVLLTINHQRRFNLPLLKVKELLAAGAIGALVRMEGAWHNVFDAGTHVFDMMFYFNNDTPAEWVVGQIDMRGGRRAFGAIQAGHGITEFRFRNGVRAVYHFGHQHEELGCLLRLVGEKGIIEILFDAPWLRMIRQGDAEWQVLDTGENIHDDNAIYRGIKDMLDALDTGAVPQLASERALRPTEIIFATHESARRRGRVDLPLPAGPCAMLTMLAGGDISEGFAP